MQHGRGGQSCLRLATADGRLRHRALHHASARPTCARTERAVDERLEPGFAKPKLECVGAVDHLAASGRASRRHRAVTLYPGKAITLGIDPDLIGKLSDRFDQCLPDDVATGLGRIVALPGPKYFRSLIAHFCLFLPPCRRDLTRAGWTEASILYCGFRLRRHLRGRSVPACKVNPLVGVIGGQC